MSTIRSRSSPVAVSETMRRSMWLIFASRPTSPAPASTWHMIRSPNSPGIISTIPTMSWEERPRSRATGIIFARCSARIRTGSRSSSPSVCNAAMSSATKRICLSSASLRVLAATIWTRSATLSAVSPFARRSRIMRVWWPSSDRRPLPTTASATANWNGSAGSVSLAIDAAIICTQWSPGYLEMTLSATACPAVPSRDAL